VTTPLKIVATDRAFVQPRVPEHSRDTTRPPGRRRQPPGQRVLLLHIVPRRDPTQWLHIGAYRLCAWNGHSCQVREQGLILRDDTPEDREAAGRYAKAHGLAVWLRDEFCRRVLVWESYRLGTLTAAVDLPSALGRLSIACGTGRGRFRNGFLLRVGAEAWVPRVRVRVVEGEMAFVEWSGYYTDPQHPRAESPGHRVFRGRWLDLAQLSNVLSGDDGDLTTLCERWGVEGKSSPISPGAGFSEAFLDGVFQDLDRTWHLFEALRAEWNRWCPPFVPLPAPAPRPEARTVESPDLDPAAVLPYRLHSPATLGKALFERIGLRGLLEVHRG
jgi:hypothetical protein